LQNKGGWDVLGRLNQNQILAIVIAVFSIAYLVGAFQIRVFPLPRPVDSDVIPKVLGFAMLGLAVLLYFQKPGTGGAVVLAKEDPVEVKLAAPHWSENPVIQVVLTVLAIAAFAALLRPLGFAISSALLLFGLAALYGYRAWTINLLVAIAVPLFLYLVLTRAMGINLPRGILPF
jgi:putative tricarboxylic transport membrane protein